jgi:hypothetical protein
MLFSSRPIFSTITVACLVLSATVNAAPIRSTTLYVPVAAASETSFLLTESLSEYYENIVDQVMLDVSDQVLSYLPESISHGDNEGTFVVSQSLVKNLGSNTINSSPISSKVLEP